MDLRWSICNMYSYSALLSTAMIMQGLEVHVIEVSCKTATFFQEVLKREK